MNNGLAPVSVSSQALAGTIELKGNALRRYLAIYSDADCNITIDNTSFTLPAGVPYAPIPCPINSITVTGTSGIIMEG